MNYKFKKYTYGWLAIHVSTPSIGLVHKKKYLPDVTPQNQATLNVYTFGKFEVACEDAGFKQVLGINDSSLDLTIGTFPADSISIETPVETPACRVCFSVPQGGKWIRAAAKVVKGEEVVLTSEQVALFVLTTGWNGEGEPEIYAGSSFTTREDGFVYTVQLDAA
jgi:hypothetical protein